MITDQAKLISARVLNDLKRGSTALHGTGMYTGAEHEVLMIAITVTEVPQLRNLLSETDKSAFMIVLPPTKYAGVDLRQSGASKSIEQTSAGDSESHSGALLCTLQAKHRETFL